MRFLGKGIWGVMMGIEHSIRRRGEPGFWVGVFGQADDLSADISYPKVLLIYYPLWCGDLVAR